MAPLPAAGSRSDWWETGREYWRERAAEWDGPGAEYKRLVAYYAVLRKKYKRAARYPWLSFEPEPPPPE